jgi:ABC-type transport system involved in cytochrome c biogenesis ATPase subunit
MLPHASSSSAREAHAAPASGHRSFSPSPEPGPSAGSRVGGGLSAWGLLKVAFAPSSALLNTIPTSSGPAGVAAAGGSTRGDTRRETAEEQTAAEQAARWHEEEREDGGAEEEDGESSPTFEEEEGSHETIHAATNAAVQREDSVSRGPTFHEGTDVLAEDVPTSSSIPVHPPSEHASAASARLAAKASSAAPGGGGKLQNRKSSALKGYDSRPPEERKAERIQQALAKIQDPDVRALLDPSNEKYFDDSSMREWPMEKLKAFVMAFEPDLIETFLQKVKVAGIRDPNAESIAPETAISWRNLYYSVNGTTMLQNVSGYVKPGMLVAVLGGPDAGITTLLDVLAGRTSPKSELMGDIFVNRRKPDHTFKRQVGYVQKQDTHLPQLTVSETLYFSARLRNPDMTRKAALMRVAIIMKLLGLLHTWNTLLGDDNIRGVSGGEKRRSAIQMSEKKPSSRPPF